MIKLLNSINTRIKYIINNSHTKFIHHRCDIINIKLDELKDRKFKDQETVNAICNSIINNDISMMKGVLGETNMVYKKMDELAEFVEQIKTAYFEENKK